MITFRNICRYVLFFMVSFLTNRNVQAQFGAYDIAAINGDYVFSYQQTPDNLVPVYAVNTGTSYSWEQCLTPGFDQGSVTAVGSSATFVFNSPLSQTTYFRRKITVGGVTYISNVLKIEVVSKNWEDINYLREHDVLVSGITDWKAVDRLPIGEKLQTTTYLDGLGRPVQKVSAGTANPSQPGGQWGDGVQFYQYDTYGREVQKFQPYTTTNQPGRFKTDPASDQSTYYADPAAYNETYPYSGLTYENSPLARVLNTKKPGTSWAAGPGESVLYTLNDASDNVQQFIIDYPSGSLPQMIMPYADNTLEKIVSTDANGKQAIQYVNSQGQMVLSKTQIADAPVDAYNGWMCTYYVYDDFGRLRYEIPPEAVKWLAGHSGGFSVTGGQEAADGLCFRYEYDAKGRMILKKAPGARPLRMIYDSRDRVVFMQDGNQAAKSPAEWMVNLYDDLDRTILTTLYRTSKTTAELQADLDNAVTYSSITINNPDQPVKDLVIDNRQTSITEYAAQHSIEFYPGFESASGDNFTAGINPNVVTTETVTTAVFDNPVSEADLNNPAVCTIVKYNFYDNYNFAGVKSFDNSFDNTTAWPSGTDVLPIAPDNRTSGFATGSMVRVLGTDIFLAATNYYDADGNLIQSIEENIKSGKDVTTMQYQWDGRLLSTYSKHTTAGSGYSDFGILTKNIFDKIGRVVSIQKKYGGNPFKTVASYDLDDMGRLSVKHLDPDAPGGEPEALRYSYNIQGNITGINKDYALKTPGKYSKWGHYFGLYLGYDNRDAVFNTAQLDGHVTGLLWNTQGDDNQRKYDYKYDNSGRLVKADFMEKKAPGDAWGNTNLDFSIGGAGTGGTIQYDLNGNLLSLQRKGVVPGSGAPVMIDNLTYSYASLSNQLVKVTDNGALGTGNGVLGDFKDGANGGDDYAYDGNGNLIADLNKNVTGVAGGVSTQVGTSGITYNFLDKPEFIRISGKGTLQIIYDADGNKLQRKYTPDGGATQTTTYINEFVYQGDSLSYINFEEGRIRLLTPVSQNNGYDGLAIDGNIDLPNGKRGAFDYFIRDYQQNVRMILTEETHYGINECTMESARAANEEPVFGQQGTGNEVALTRIGNPPGWSSNTSNSVSKLGKLTGHTIGPNSLLKVMAGDMINARADYYYEAPVTNNTNPLIGDIVASLVNAISGSPATPDIVHGNTGNISSDLNASVPFQSIADPDKSGSGNIPRAYLNVMFFNERFEFVEENSTALRVSQPGDGAAPLVLSDIKAPKNGYVYIYLSNENDDAVYFDNFTVSFTRGKIIEENHYYAFGLRIAGISSRKFDGGMEGSLKNEFLYQGDFAELDEDIGWYDFELRNYDAQVGRFIQSDPFGQFASTYTGMGNNPVNLIDPTGGIGIPCPGTSQLAIFFMKAGEVIGNGLNAISHISSLVSVGVHTIQAGTEIYNNSIQFKIINRQLTANVTLQAGVVQQGNEEWQKVSIILAESRSNGAGSGPDWVRNLDPQGIKIDDLSNENDDELLNDLRSTIHTYTQGVMTDVGDRMVNHFADNTGSDFSDKVLNNHIRASSQFQDKFSSALQSIKTEIQRVNGDFLKYVKQGFGLPSFPKWDPKAPFTPNSLYTLIGGTQYGSITLTKYKYDAGSGRFTGVINVTIMDDFGVSASDVKKASNIPFSKGIRAMWYLQNIRGYKPYRTVFSRQFQIKF